MVGDKEQERQLILLDEKLKERQNEIKEEGLMVTKRKRGNEGEKDKYN